MSEKLLDQILKDQPALHAGETETLKSFSAEQTFLRGSVLDNLLMKVPTCYGIEPDLARFLFHSVSEQSKTLETGSGISTLVFALRGAKHIAVTPSRDEVANIKKYAAANGISMESVEFVVEPSDQYLPRCQARDLDLVLIDGKHAFPWPVLDWFFTADKLKIHGVVVLDDAQMSSVSMLSDFLAEDPRWKLERSIGKRTLVFQKVAESVHDVSWHMQPYITHRYGRKAKLLRRLGLKKRGPRF